MIFTEARRQRLENAALVEQEEMLSAALQELPHTLKLLYKSLNKKDTTRARKILGLICGQMGMVATHLGAEREASLLSRLWKQLRGGGGAAAGMAGTEALEAMDNPDWIKAAEKLLTANKGKTQDDFYYRAYLRAIIAKKPAKHLVSKYPAAKQAQADLIDAAGKGDS